MSNLCACFFCGVEITYLKMAQNGRQVHLVYGMLRGWLCFCNNEMLFSVVVLSSGLFSG